MLSYRTGILMILFLLHIEHIRDSQSSTTTNLPNPPLIIMSCFGRFLIYGEDKKPRLDIPQRSSLRFLFSRLIFILVLSTLSCGGRARYYVRIIDRQSSASSVMYTNPSSYVWRRTDFANNCEIYTQMRPKQQRRRGT